MNVSEFTARALLLLTPGVISVLIVDALTVHAERKPFAFLIHSFVFGAASYSLYAVVWWLNSIVAALLGPLAVPISWWPRNITILNALVDNKHTINFSEVALTAALAIPMAIFVSYSLNHKLLHRAASGYGITKKFGEPDVWGFTFELREAEWVRVRDLSSNLLFEGWVRAFSDIESPRELLLFDAVVYKNDSGEELYSVDAIYVSRKNEDWTVEFPNIKRTLIQEEVPDDQQAGESRPTESNGRSTEAGSDRGDSQEGRPEFATDHTEAG
ncbi:MAG: DUF6338 family protein [Candidatus Paceibacterota bacterium]